MRHTFLQLSFTVQDSPYQMIKGRHVDVRQLYPFWCRCWVYIPLNDRHGKVNAPPALKAHFVGYSYTTILTKTYKYIEVYADGTYGKVRVSKDNIIFDQSINFTMSRQEITTEDAFGYASVLQFPLSANRADRRVHFSDTPVLSRFPPRPGDLPTPPLASILKVPPSQDTPRVDPLPSDHPPEQPLIPPRNVSSIQRIDRQETSQHDRLKPSLREQPRPGPGHNDLQQFNPDEVAPYWFNYLAPSHEYSISSVETEHFTLTIAAKYSTIPKTFWQAMKRPEWALAINKEREKFEVNHCLAEVPYTDQHLVPMMWLFNVKTDGTQKARLVGRGDMMIP